MIRKRMVIQISKLAQWMVKSHKKGRPRFEDHTVLHSGNKRLGKHSGLRLLHKELKAHNVHVYLTKDDVDWVLQSLIWLQ